jgi:hypothetical protein
VHTYSRDVPPRNCQQTASTRPQLPQPASKVSPKVANRPKDFVVSIKPCIVFSFLRSLPISASLGATQLTDSEDSLRMKDRMTQARPRRGPRGHSWTTDNDLNLIHRRLIGVGGSAEVHEVRYHLINLMSRC